MADRTGFLGMLLPEPNDAYDIEVFNANSQLVDASAQSLDASIKALSDTFAQEPRIYVDAAQPALNNGDFWYQVIENKDSVRAEV